MGVDVAAEAGLRAVNVACHTVPCHLQLKFADFLFNFFHQLERSVAHFHINVPGDAGAERLHFPFLGRGGLLMAWYRIAAIQQTVSVLQQFVAGFLIRTRNVYISKST